MTRADGPDGVLVVDKPEGPTSHDVVAVARRALGTSRVGHTGTLDPMATGVLVLVVGRATRLARYMAHDAKDYVARVTFGRATTTYDAQGEPTRDTGLTPSREALVAALATLASTTTQTPPAYSAKKIGGEVAHKAARRDAPLDLPPVAVTVHRLTLDDYDAGVATLSMRVSAGFYVRSLAHDLGEVLGTGAHLSGLRRTQAGAFDLSQAIGLDTMVTDRPAARAAMLPLHALVPDLPAAVLTADGVERLRHGQTVQATITGDATSEVLRLMDELGHLLGIGRPAGRAHDGRATILQPVVVLG